MTCPHCNGTGEIVIVPVGSTPWWWPAGQVRDWQAQMGQASGSMLLAQQQSMGRQDHVYVDSLIRAHNDDAVRTALVETGHLGDG